MNKKDTWYLVDILIGIVLFVVWQNIQKYDIWFGMGIGCVITLGLLTILDKIQY